MEQLFSDFLAAISPALQTLLLGVFNLLAIQAMAWLNEQYKLKKRQLSLEQQALLDVVTFHTVRAAEQLYDSQSSKKAYAIDATQKALEKYGIKLDVAQIVTAVESAVFVKNEQIVEPPVSEEQG